MKEHFNVLIIDDDEIHTFIVSRLIRKINPVVKIETLKNGKEGLEHIKTSLTRNTPLPSAIIVDINMPVMNGIEFLEELKTLDINLAALPIIFLSNEIHPRDYEKLKQLGADNISIKPLTYEKLSNILA
ncbi:MAG: response regulator [Cytophagaceae bacterium]|nr:response regulator [Cytophagaceae bacterium]